MDCGSVSTVAEIVACACVCLRMFFRAAFASAAGAVSRGAHVGQVDLDPTGPDRDCPFAFEGDPAAPCVLPEDFPVSDNSAPASSLPPALGAPSAEQKGLRKEVYSTLRSLFASSAARGAARTYGANLRAIAPRVTAKRGSCAFPMDSEGVV